MDEAELTRELRAELRDGETLLWSGRPRQGAWIRGTDAIVIPFSILWCGFAIFWVVGATRAAGIFGAFGIPFVAAGLYFVFGRFVTDAIARSKVIYGLTDTRLIVVKAGSRRSVTSTQRADLGSVSLSEGRGGRGTILYGTPPRMGFGVPPNWPGTSLAPQATQPRLDGIEDARHVYQLMTS